MSAPNWNTGGPSGQALRWPPGWPRTLQNLRLFARRFDRQGRQITFDEAFDSLRDELYRFGAQRVEISFDCNGQDPGAAVYFLHDDEPRVMAQDAFWTTAANLRSLALAVEAMRT